VCTGLLTVPANAPPSKSGGDASSSCWWLDHPDNPAPPAEEESPMAAASEPLVNRRVVAGAVLAAGFVVAGMVGMAAWISKPVAPPVQMVAAAAVDGPLELVPVGIRAAETPVASAPSLEALLAPVAKSIPVPEDFMEVRWPAIDELPAKLKVGEQPAPPAAQVTIKRRDRSSDEDLRKQLLNMAEVTLDVPGKVNRSSHISAAAINTPSKHFTPQLLAHWPDLQGMPYRMGNDCQLGKEPAENMQAMSRKLRSIMAESMNRNGGDNRLNAEFIADKLASGDADFQRAGAVPCLMQMLQPESQSVRQVMVSRLVKISHRAASEALAKVAIFDLDEEVREKAIKDLAKRPREEYRHVLLAGLRYPWAPAADHAAEALVAVQDKQAVPALAKMVADVDPTAATYDAAHNIWTVNEVVRVNHLSNCMMCHAPSRATSDLVRGRIPSPGQPLPPMTQYYEDNRGIFVRADVTYLKQDFSVYQPVENPGQWPLMQRYDYLVRTRKVETAAELAGRQKKPDANYPQREAVLFALNELTR
jgi:hypothetical protein